jgi:acetyl-CoA C-acetyltransferase
MYGGGDLARHAAVAAGMPRVPGQAVNRHCAASLTAIANAAGSIRAGMDKVVIAGGVQSTSLMPQLTWRVPGTQDTTQAMPPTFPHTDSVNDDVTINVGWNTAQEVGLSREEVDAWAARSHQRAVDAIDAGTFDDEIVPVQVTGLDGQPFTFSTDEGPRRGSSVEKLATLKPLHPEIDGFSVTAGNASGINDAAAALVLADADVAAAQGLTPLATVRAWASVGVEPARTGMGAIEVIPVVLDRAGLTVADVDLWEINEAFASVVLKYQKDMEIPDDKLNVNGGAIAMGHPLGATGAIVLGTMVDELERRDLQRAVVTLCIGGGMGVATLIERV